MWIKSFNIYLLDLSVRLIVILYDKYIYYIILFYTIFILHFKTNINYNI